MKKEVDYIIVGLGIAGIAFAETLQAYKKSFLVIDHSETNATKIAAGTLNPTVLKRFTAVWNVDHFLPKVLPFFADIARKTGVAVHSESEILRIFNSREEQNDWFVASDKHSLSKYIQPRLIPNENPNVIAPFGFGKVQGVVKVDTPRLVQSYRSYLAANQLLWDTTFQYDLANPSEEGIVYEAVHAKKIVFCEGVGALQNPWFTQQEIRPRKGEYLIVKAPQLQLKQIIKGPHFLIPLGEDRYMVGATFNRVDTSLEPTQKAREELRKALSKMIRCDYTVVDQKVGLRPTVKDRRPILGNLSVPNSYILNGLGTRGLMAAPTLAEQLFKYIEQGIPFEREIAIDRFS